MSRLQSQLSSTGKPLEPLLDAVMERRARRLMDQVREWLPSAGPVLDLGSGTGHFAARLEQETGIKVTTADVSDIHVVGPAPVRISDGPLPFDDATFTGALLFFMLAYPREPSAVLSEVARVTRGPIIIVQSVYSGRLGYAWHRGREFFWTILAFYVSRLLGYVPRNATFAMSTRRFYTAEELRGEVSRAGLRVRSQNDRAVLPGRALVVAGWVLEPDD